MNLRFNKYKGIHPGIVIERELKRRSIKQRPFALLLQEHPQTFNAIAKGKRGLSTGLALKIERELGLEEGALVLLQAYYDIEKIKEKEKSSSPNLLVLNKALFWDTDFEQIDWTRQALAVIQRVFERGDENEKEEIIRFYGAKKVEHTLKKLKARKPYTIQKEKNI